MKLSQLTPRDKLRLAAELDGIEISDHQCFCYSCLDTVGISYDTSFNAIIPLIQKQSIAIQHDIWYRIKMPEFTPSQLLDALLIATGKAEL